ncbi:hypothetical protein NP233_g8284 [Leucocoprinus birnbaumii]|uniref:Uncharacterized protein n=1 Tax=Leucocoprinus birnbaumii TaxID=56174 RepID=A0AAD5VMP3_9AGAR|nr:hypothetical protein NP233_g8284 [Leucocoprinus birnbaumii]
MLNVFGAEADSSKQKQLYDWVRNHCKTVGSDLGTDSDSDSSTNADESSDEDSSQHVSQSPRRRQGFRAIVIANNKPTIKAMIQAGYSKEDTPAPHEYIALWNNAVTKLIENLPQEVRTQYEMEAVKNEVKQSHGPTVEEIYNVQNGLHARAAEVLLELLGWDRKQYGDALFFVSLAYRDKLDNICTQRVFVSNVKEYNKHKKSFLKKYDTHVAAEMANLAACSLPKAREIPTLPRHISTVEGRLILLPIDTDDISTNEMKQTLKTFIELLWKEVNPTDDILWQPLEDSSNFHEILVHHSALEFFACLNPDKLKRQELEHLAFQLNLDPTLLTFKRYAPSKLNDSGSILPESTTETGPSDVVGLIGDSLSSRFFHSLGNTSVALVTEECSPLTGLVDNTQAAQVNNTTPIPQSDVSIIAPFQSHMVPLTNEVTTISPGKFSAIHSANLSAHMIPKAGAMLTNITPALESTRDDEVRSMDIQVPTSIQLQDGTQYQSRKKAARKGKKQTNAQRQGSKPSTPSHKVLNPIEGNGSTPPTVNVPEASGRITRRAPSGRLTKVPNRAPTTITTEGQEEPERVPKDMRYGWQTLISSSAGEIQVVEGLVGNPVPQTGKKTKASKNCRTKQQEDIGLAIIKDPYPSFTQFESIHRL